LRLNIDILLCLGGIGKEAAAPGTGVDVEPVRPDEADHGQAVFPGQAHGEARRGPDRRQDRTARHHRLLHQLEAGSAADQEHAVRDGRGAGEEPGADQFVEGVVEADVPARAQELASRVE
jgi:hypothetical protein